MNSKAFAFPFKDLPYEALWRITLCGQYSYPYPNYYVTCHWSEDSDDWSEDSDEDYPDYRISLALSCKAFRDARYHCAQRAEPLKRGPKDKQIVDSIPPTFVRFSALQTLSAPIIAYDVASLAPVSSLAQLVSLDFSSLWPSMSDMSLVSNLTALTKLDFSWLPNREWREKLSGDVISLEPLRSHRALKILDCCGHEGIKDLTPISSLYSLETLHFARCGVTSLSALVGLSSIKSLNLSQCRDITDLTPLRHLSNIQHLSFSDCSRITDLTHVSHLSKLQLLQMRNCLGIDDLSPLGSLSLLTTLHCSGCLGISDLSPLAKLRNLEHINCRDCPLIPIGHTRRTYLDRFGRQLFTLHDHFFIIGSDAGTLVVFH